MLTEEIKALKLELANYIEHRALALGFIATYDIPKSESGECIDYSIPITNMDSLPHGLAVEAIVHEAIVHEATSELWRRLVMHAPPARIDSTRLSTTDVISRVVDSNYNLIVSPDIGTFLITRGYRFLSDFPGHNANTVFGLCDVAVSGNIGDKYVVRDRYAHVSYMLEIVERGRFVIDDIEIRTVEYAKYLDVKIDIQWPKMRRTEFENLNLRGA